MRFIRKRARRFCTNFFKMFILSTYLFIPSIYENAEKLYNMSRKKMKPKNGGIYHAEKV